MTTNRFGSALLTGALGLCLSGTALVAQEKTQAIDPLEWTFADGTEITVYGQINMGVMSFDDGGETTSYGLVDNDNSSTRIGVRSTTGYDGGWELFSNIEIEYQPHPSNSINQLDRYASDYGFDNGNIRKIEAAVSNDRYGKLWLGQGSMASDGIAESDLSGTGVIAYSSVSDSGGGLFRFDDGDLSDVATGGAFSNMDGLGRKTRIRYDTPSFYGITLKASYGQDALNDNEDDLYDIAATYEGEYDRFEVAASAGYARNEGSDTDILAGSVSGLHTPTGLSLTLAAGSTEADDDASYGYAKLGWERALFGFGSTAFAVDYYDGDSVATDGSDSTSYAFAAVQNVDYWNTEAYLIFRQYEYDDDAGDYQDGLTTFAGLRVRF